MCKYDRERQVLRKGDRIIFVSDRAEDNGHLKYGMTGTVLRDCPEDITWVYITWEMWKNCRSPQNLMHALTMSLPYS